MIQRSKKYHPSGMSDGLEYLYFNRASDPEEENPRKIISFLLLYLGPR